jgi:hypothetical protein
MWNELTKISRDLMEKGIEVTDSIESLRIVRILLNQDNYIAINRNRDPSNQMNAKILYELQSIEDLLLIKAANEIGESYATELSARISRLGVRKEKEKEQAPINVVKQTEVNVLPITGITLSPNHTKIKK